MARNCIHTHSSVWPTTCNGICGCGDDDAAAHSAASPSKTTTTLTRLYFILFLGTAGVCVCVCVQVFLYGYIDHDDTEGKKWGCVAHALGMLDGILKITYGR